MEKAIPGNPSVKMGNTGKITCIANLEENGVRVFSDPVKFIEIENLYFNVRNKEGRILTDSTVKDLPFTAKSDPYHKEWKIRRQSFIRVMKYFKNLNKELRILEVGCGNGWLSGRLSNLENSRVIGIDINSSELIQAGRIFGHKPNIEFYYGDISGDQFPRGEFDIIILAASIQYFPDLSNLISGLFNYLNHDGEIHIFDSPFYKENLIGEARNRSRNYYLSIGYPQMAEYYFHHTIQDLDKLNPVFLYSPHTFKNKVTLKFFQSDSPFPWLKIQKN